MSQSWRRQLPALIFLALIVFFGIFPRLLLGPLLVEISGDLGITTGQATRLFLFVSVGYTCSMLLSGLLSQHIGHRRTLIVSGCGTGVGAIACSVAPSLPALQVSAVILGVGPGLYAPSGIPTVASLVSGENRGKAFSIHELGPNAAKVVAPLFAAWLLPITSWRLILGMTGLACIANAGTFAQFGRGTDAPGEPPRLRSVVRVMSERSFWIVAGLLAVVGSASLGVYAVLPSFLIQERGMDASFVNTVIGISRVSGVVMVFVSGFFVDRLGLRRTLAATFGLIAVFTCLLGIARGPLLVVAVLLQPILVPAALPAILSAVSQVGPPELRNLAVALVVPAGNFFGNGVFPSVAGVLAEYERFGWSFVILAVVMVVALGASELLGSVNTGLREI